VRETSGSAPARATLRNGRDDTSEVVAVIDLAAGQAQTVGLPGSGVAVGEALWLDVDEGDQLQGAVFLGAVD
jgi:hypothetical protein